MRRLWFFALGYMSRKHVRSFHSHLSVEYSLRVYFFCYAWNGTYYGHACFACCQEFLSFNSNIPVHYTSFSAAKCWLQYRVLGCQSPEQLQPIKMSQVIFPGEKKKAAMFGPETKLQQQNQMQVSKLVSWCFEPSQPPGIIQGLKENLRNQIQSKRP